MFDNFGSGLGKAESSKHILCAYWLERKRSSCSAWVVIGSRGNLTSPPLLTAPMADLHSALCVLKFAAGGVEVPGLRLGRSVAPLTD